MDNRDHKWALATLDIYSRILSVEELRQLVPIEPDETRQKGTSRGKRPGNVFPYTVLTFKSRLDDSAHPTEHLGDLLDRVHTAKQEIREFAERTRVADPDARMYVYVRLVVETSRREVGFDFSPYLHGIAELGAGFGIEVDIADDDDCDA
jgi:Domain of unknown function (DUF4279)